MTAHLYELLRHWVADRPSAPALICQESAITWSELRARVDCMAAALLAAAPNSQVPVGIWLSNTPHLCTALVAAAHAGRKALLLSPDSKALEVEALAQTVGCRQVITERPVEDCGSLSRLTPQELLRDAPDAVGPHSPLPDGFLYIPTSGTTGSSKLILRTEDKLAFLGAAYSSTVGIGPSDGIFCLLPQSHGFGLCTGFLAALASGASLYLEPQFHRHTALRLLTGGNITITVGVPYHFEVLARSFTSEPLNLSSIRYAFSGGAALPVAAWEHIHGTLGLPLRQTYGSTETGLATVNIHPHPQRNVESSGTPLHGVQVRVNDDGCVSVRSQATATALLSLATGQPVPLPIQDGWVRTGDLGRIDPSGQLYITGRVSQFLNIAGRKVDPLEVESVLASHPAVQEAVVIETDGGSQPAAKALVVCRQPCDPAALLAFCQSRLADYKVPAVIEFRDALPRTPSGKLQRRPGA